MDSDTSKQFIMRLNYQLSNEVFSNSNLSLEGLAQRLCMTRGQLNRKVKAITGMTTGGYIQHVRTEKASRLLITHPEMAISEIAVDCGFDNMSYFARLFKRDYNLTPSQYRNAYGSEEQNT